MIAIKKLLKFILKKTGDVGEKLSSEHKKLNIEIFRRIFQNVHYLVPKGLPLRGHDDGANSN